MILKIIKRNLKSNINIYFIDIHDDSKLHNLSNNHLTHIKIIIISDDFININFITRHRIIFKILKKIMAYKIYSITLYTYTITEWKTRKNKNINTIQCFQKKS